MIIWHVWCSFLPNLSRALTFQKKLLLFVSMKAIKADLHRPNFIVWLSLLLEILGNMRIAIVCFPGRDVKNFEITNIKAKIKDKNLNTLERKKLLRIHWRLIFAIVTRCSRLRFEKVILSILNLYCVLLRQLVGLRYGKKKFCQNSDKFGYSFIKNDIILMYLLCIYKNSLF